MGDAASASSSNYWNRSLVALWHYLVIGFPVAAALALIYLFHKKQFSREHLLQRRIARGKC